MIVCAEPAALWSMNRVDVPGWLKPHLTQEIAQPLELACGAICRDVLGLHGGLLSVVLLP